MNCMKCGRELREGQVFCDSCLESMEREPVNINTVVNIPAQPPKPAASYRRPVLNPDEELKRLQKVNQNLILWLLLVGTAAFVLLVFAYYQQFWDVVEDLGRNYSVLETGVHSIGR